MLIDQVDYTSVLPNFTSVQSQNPFMLQAIPGGPKPAPGVHVILDLVGASHFPGNIECLTVEGKLLLVGVPSGTKAEANLALVCYLASIPCHALAASCLL